VSHPKWVERPLAVVVLREGAKASAEDLREFLSARLHNYWVPDAFEFIDAIPRTSTGKFLKSALREKYRSYQLPVKPTQASRERQA
jgi:fatty-acyl-CoA synthase